jgi:gp32 DNA binding protein like
MSFSELKKKSSLGSLTSKLLNEVEKMNSSGGGADDRVWKPEVDKAGNGFAVIRFLPSPEGEELPCAKVYTHAFQGTGGWLIDNCLTTINQSCPVCEANRELWNTGSKSNQEIVRQRKRKLSYYSNIYVVSDKAHPENEGKVFLFKYGKKIFDKISAAMQPEFDDETPIDPFDFWNGANFKVKITKKDGYWNYDKSEFDSPSTLGGFDDDVLESIWKKAYSLEEFVKPEAFKSYEQLDARLKSVLGKKQVKQDESFEDEDSDSAPSLTEDLRSELGSLSSRSKSNSSNELEEDDTLSYFARLAEE